VISPLGYPSDHGWCDACTAESIALVPVTWGTAILKRLGQHAGNRYFEKDAAMNKHVGVREFEPSPAKAGILRRILAFLAKLLASPKGDQGGWEGGARGL
jgi:hypothetical protein